MNFVVTSQKLPGEISLITGPMFAKKSTFLIIQIRKDRANGTTTIVLGWSGDVRSDHKIKTHDLDSEPAVMVPKLEEVFSMEEYEEASKVIIDEGHFFTDLCTSVLLMAHRDGKDVLVAGLYADYQAEPFEQMVGLMAHARVRFLTAICKLCGDETKAVYTRLIQTAAVGYLPEVSRINVGGSEKYMPVCAKHYLS